MPRPPTPLSFSRFEELLGSTAAAQQFEWADPHDLAVAVQVCARKTAAALSHASAEGPGLEALDGQVRAHLGTTLALVCLLAQRIGIDLEYLAELGLATPADMPVLAVRPAQDTRQAMEVLR